MDEIDELLNGSLDIVEKADDNLIGDEEYNDLITPSAGRGAEWSKRYDVGNTGLGDSQWDDGATRKDVEEGKLNARRAELQPWQDQLANAASQAVLGEIVGGTLEGVGYLLDWEGIGNLVVGEEKEFGNWFSDIGKGIREGTADATQIYEKTPGEMNLSDSGYWFKNSVSVASTLSMMLPSMMATKVLGKIGRGLSKVIGKGAQKGAARFGKKISEEAFNMSSKMGVKADWMANGMSQAVVSRHIENTMESSGTFEETYNSRLTQINPKTNVLFTENEARESAAGAAAENYKHGWAMLAQDMVQYLAIGKVFNPITRQMEVAGKLGKGATGMAKNLKKAGGVAGTFASEGAEEGYQHYIASRAQLNSDLQAGLISQEEFDNQLGEVMGSDEAKTSMLFGGLGGSVFQMVGPKANEVFKSKSKKEIKKKSEEEFKNGIGNKNKVHAAMQIEKSLSDQSGSLEEIEMQQEELILSMVLDGLENDNMEMVMDAIANGPEMTKEELEKFGKENGYEWDNDLAKSGAKRALEVAAEVKAIHLKNRNKAKNKNVDPSIVKSMSRIEFQNKEYSKKIESTQKENRERIEGLTFDNKLKPQDSYLEAKDLESKIVATKVMIKRQQDALDKAIDKEIKKSKKELIKNHSYDLSVLEKQAKKLKEPKKGEKITADEKEGNDRAAKVFANEGLQHEIAGGYLKEMVFNDAITENQLQLGRLNDKAYQKALTKTKTEDSIKNTTDISTLENFNKEVEAGNIEGYTSAAEKKNITKKVSARIAELKQKVLDEKAKELDEKSKQDLKDKIDKENADKKTPDNNVVVPVKEALEDEHRYEEVWFEDQIADEQEQAVEDRTDKGKTIALLDGKGQTSSDYKTWTHNGVSKIGTVVRYELAKRGFHTVNPKSRGAKAVRFFNAMKAGTEITDAQRQFAYDHLPIQVFIGKEGDKINTFLTERPKPTDSDIMHERYQNNYANERKVIIDFLLTGTIPTSTIKHTGGGQLQTQKDDNGVVAENNIKDLKQVKASKKRPHLVFSDIDGNLMEMDKKTPSDAFRGKSLSVGEDENGKPMPYRGGLFLLLKKADGTPFPVRMNFLKNTQEQADVLADILIGISVPLNRKGEKTYTFKTPLSQTDPEMQARVKEVMGAEVDFLKGKSDIKNDPTLGDLVNMFVYMNDNTEGLTSQLYRSGVNLYFGDKGNHIKPENVAEKRGELVQFLAETKRRQLSITMWNDTKNFPGYRDFVIDNKIINTNVVVGENEFQTGTSTDKVTGEKKTRRVQIYVAPLDNKVASKPVVVAKKKEAVVKTIVGNQGVANDVSEQTGPSEVEINAAIAKKFPGKMYQYGLYVDSMGQTRKKLNEAVVPAEDVKAIDKIKADMQAEFDANKKPVKEEVKPTPTVTKLDLLKTKFISMAGISRREIDTRDKDSVYKDFMSQAEEAGRNGVKRSEFIKKAEARELEIKREVKQQIKEEGLKVVTNETYNELAAEARGDKKKTEETKEVKKGVNHFPKDDHHRKRLENSMSKREFKKSGQDGIITLNEDGSYKESGYIEEGKYVKATGQSESNVKDDGLKSAQKEYKEDKAQLEALNSGVTTKINELSDRLGGLKAVKEVLSKGGEFEDRGGLSMFTADPAFYIISNLGLLDSINKILDAEINKSNTTEVNNATEITAQSIEDAMKKDSVSGGGNGNKGSYANWHTNTSEGDVEYNKTELNELNNIHKKLPEVIEGDTDINWAERNTLQVALQKKVLQRLLSSTIDDTKISKPVKKDVPSKPARQVRTRKRTIGSGKTTSKRPARTKKVTDKNIKKEDDTKQPKCSDGSQTSLF